MKDDFAFFLVVISTISSVAFFNGQREVHADQITTATDVCAPHGGVRIIDGNFNQPSNISVTTDVTCNNGTRISAVTKRGGAK
jgi:hypothetical protein